MSEIQCFKCNVIHCSIVHLVGYCKIVVNELKEINNFKVCMFVMCVCVCLRTQIHTYIGHNGSLCIYTYTVNHFFISLLKFHFNNIFTSVLAYPKSRKILRH
jgi:hypothetical protein